MATRFYYVANTTAPVSPSTQAAWESTLGFVRRSMATVQNAATETLSGALTGDEGSNLLSVQLISDPLVASQTISGQISIVSRGRELNATDNVNQRRRMIYLVSEDGTTFRSTLFSFGVGGGSTELSTTMSAQQHASSNSLTSQTTADGDRLVVELGYGANAIGSTPQFEMVLGGSGTDHTNSNNSTAGTVPWLEFTANLFFKTPDPPASGFIGWGVPIL